MPQKEFLETGKIINTHGVRGEVKLEVWADSPASLTGLKTLWLGERPMTVEQARVHKNFVIAKLQGIDTVEAAMTLKGKVVSAARKDLPLPEGSYFLVDLIGLPVYTEDGNQVGTLKDVLDYPSGRIYVVQGQQEHLIPEKGDFLKDVDLQAGRITVALIEGM